MSTSVNLTIRMDKQLKQELEILSRRLGMSVSGLMNVFATGFVRTKRVPAEYVDAGPAPKLLHALDESNEIIAKVRSGETVPKGYNNLDTMWAALDESETKETAHARAH